MGSHASIAIQLLKEQVNPPKFSLRFFYWYCKESLQESVLGDLYEQFDEDVDAVGIRKAKLRFVWNVIRFCRSGIRKPLLENYQFNHFGMLKNYFKVGYRNILRNKTHSTINIIGLALGMATTVLIGLWSFDELTFDDYHEQKEKVARVMKRRTYNGKTRAIYSQPFGLVDELKNVYGENFEYVSIASWPSSRVISHETKSISMIGNSMGVDGPKLLDVKMVEGSADGLIDLHGILISEKAALTLFDRTDCIGETLQINNELNATIKGVYKDFPINSSFHELKYIANYQHLASTNEWMSNAMSNDKWSANFCLIYVQANHLSTIEETEAKVAKAIYHNVDDRGKESDPEVILHAMSDWHLKANWKNGVQSGGLILIVRLMIGIGIFVMVLASINFINLSTANSLRRAKEVGMRKSLGSNRRSLIAQFLIESFLVVLLSFSLCLILVVLSLPAFNQLSGKALSIPFSTANFWFISIVFVVLTSVLSGGYPAFYISSFRPIKALKGSVTFGSRSGKLRKTLVVIQITVSIILISGTAIVYQQIQYTKDRSMGYEINNLITLSSSTTDFVGKFDLLKTEWNKSGAVLNVSQSSSPLTEVNATFSGFEWEGKDPSLSTNFVTVWVTPEFGSTVNWNVMAGQDFTTGAQSNKQHIIINQSAADFMSMKDPIGNTVKWRGENYKVLGVVENMIAESPFSTVRPCVYLTGEDLNQIQISLHDEMNRLDAIDKIETVFKSVLPQVPFSFQYADQVHQRKYATEESIGELTKTFAFLAVIISCLGLFGLSSFLSHQKAKEIGIRKILGASVVTIWSRFTKEFVYLVLIALCIAIPVSVVAMTAWLEDIHYRIALSFDTFLFVGLFVVIISTLTVSYHSLRSAFSNPIDHLKNE